MLCFFDEDGQELLLALVVEEGQVVYEEAVDVKKEIFLSEEFTAEE